MFNLDLDHIYSVITLVRKKYDRHL